VGCFLGIDAELLVANNLFKEVYKGDQDPKIVKIISCNKKCAGENKKVVAKLSASLGETMGHLVQHKTRQKFKAEEIQMSNSELKKVPGGSGIGAKSPSRIKMTATPTRSTSSALTPRAVVESIQGTSKSKVVPLPEDIKQFMEKSKSEEEVKPEMEIDVDTLEDVKLDEDAPVITKKNLRRAEDR
jgi:hypothetical protein